MVGTVASVFTPSKTVAVLGLQTEYRRNGAGSPLLYLGDQGYSGRWIPLFENLTSNFEVIVPDHPSFGGTDIPDEILDFNDLAVHYAAFLDAIGVTSVDLVGHGFGGWIASEFAAIYPERVNTLTLIAPQGTLPNKDEKMPDPFRLDRDRWLDAALGEDRGRLESIIDADEDIPNRLLTDYRERIGVARVAWNPRYSLRLQHRLQRVVAPSQVLIPESDPLVAPSVATRFAELLPAAQGTVTITGEAAPTRHLLVLQEPQQIASKIIELSARSA